jgi:flagellar biogenesis protein FliO
MRKSLTILVTLCGLSLFSLANATELPVEPEEFSYKSEFFNMMLTVTLIVILIIATGAMLKRLAKSRMHQANNAHLIKILERRPLTQKTVLYLVEVGEKNILIADTTSGVTTLAELPRESEIEEVTPSSPPSSKAKASFLDIIQSKLRQAGVGLLKKE